MTTQDTFTDEEYRSYADTIDRETVFMSGNHQFNENFIALHAIGEDVLPFLIDDLRTRQNYWRNLMAHILLDDAGVELEYTEAMRGKIVDIGLMLVRVYDEHYPDRLLEE